MKTKNDGHHPDSVRQSRVIIKCADELKSLGSLVGLVRQPALQTCAAQFIFDILDDVGCNLPSFGSSASLHMLRLMYPKSTSSGALHASTSAAGLQLMAVHHRAPQLNDQAAVAYGNAIKALNEAISQPALATSNETLLSTILLSLYEACSLFPFPETLATC